MEGDEPVGGEAVDADPVPIPPGRRRDLEAVRSALLQAGRVVLTTHVNADGDGAGSEVAVLDWLRSRGKTSVVVNPTPFPQAFEFLLDSEQVWTPRDAEGQRHLSEADCVLILDTSERSRLGRVVQHLSSRSVVVMDHHPATPDSVGEVVVRDTTACATGELVYDLLTLEGEVPTLRQARALYVALVTDTGSFRFGNTTNRAHRVAASLLEAGVDVESMFRTLHASFTRSGLDLLRRALDSLRVSDDQPVAWISLRQRDLDETGATAEDREGIVEYPRRLQGIEVALLFRELPDGRTKISLRSNGPTDVARIARDLGGGGHPQAAGALLDDDLATAESRVVERVRRDVADAVSGEG